MARKTFDIQFYDGLIERQLRCIPIEPRGWIIVNEEGEAMYGGRHFKSTAELMKQLRFLQDMVDRIRQQREEGGKTK